MIKDLPKFIFRIITSLLLGSLFIYSVIGNKYLFYLLVISFQVISVIELRRIFPNIIDSILWISLTLWIDGIVLIYLYKYELISNLSYFNYSIAFPFILSIIIVMLIMIIKNIMNSKEFNNEIVLDKIVKEFFLFFYFIGALTLSFILFEIKNSLLLLLIVVTNYSHDIFAYFVGKTVGRTPFFNNISPSKTFEGYLGGVLFSIIIGVILADKLDLFTLGQYKILAIIITIAFLCAFGDLFESLIKRVTNIKESGKIILGHGGVLDRIDSLVFSIFLSTTIYFLI